MSQKDENGREPADILESAEHAMQAAKKLATGNFNVFSAEFSLVMAKLRPRLTSAVIFATVLGLGLISFLAFAIIGLGLLLNERYWLSSLVISVFGISVGGLFCIRSLRGITDIIQFERTIRSVDRTVEAAKYTFEGIKTAASSGVTREPINAGKE